MFEELGGRGEVHSGGDGGEGMAIGGGNLGGAADGEAEVVVEGGQEGVAFL